MIAALRVRLPTVGRPQRTWRLGGFASPPRWILFFFFRLAKAQRRKGIVVWLVWLSAAADWLGGFAALQPGPQNCGALYFFFLLAKAHRGGQDAEAQRNCGPLLSSAADLALAFSFWSSCLSAAADWLGGFAALQPGPQNCGAPYFFLLAKPTPEAEQLFRRIVFNMIARNCDDHTKNFAFRLKQNSHWELAPAYDLCHAYKPEHLG